MRNAYKILVGKHEGNVCHLEDVDIDGRVLQDGLRV
jgi:hypothetical protein